MTKHSSTPRAAITIDDPPTLANALRFPVQHAAARRDVIIGGLWLFVPVVGWVLNMGHRLELVHRMQHGREPWPAWGNYGRLFRHGVLTTVALTVYHLPAAAVFVLADRLGEAWLVWLAAALWLLGTFIVPGFMTFYAKSYDVRELLFPGRAVRRAFQGGRAYLWAWVIALVGLVLSFVGLAFFGIGFALTSVWFWQVAAFGFSNVFSRQHGLCGPGLAAASVTAPAGPAPRPGRRG